MEALNVRETPGGTEAVYFSFDWGVNADPRIEATAANVFLGPGLEVWAVYVHSFDGAMDTYYSAFLPSLAAVRAYLNAIVGDEV